MCYTEFGDGMIDMKVLGENIRHIRKVKGLTQEELAQKAGLSTMSIRRYENGERIISEKVLYKISKALDVWIDDFFPDGEEIDANNFPWYTSPPHILIIDGERKYEIPTNEKTYRILSYGLRYSFSIEEREIVKNLSKLNSDGKKIAVERVKELTEIQRYQSKLELTDLSVLLLDADIYKPQAPQEGKDTTPPPDAPQRPQEDES